MVHQHHHQIRKKINNIVLSLRHAHVEVEAVLESSSYIINIFIITYVSDSSHWAEDGDGLGESLRVICPLRIYRRILIFVWFFHISKFKYYLSLILFSVDWFQGWIINNNYLGEQFKIQIKITYLSIIPNHCLVLLIHATYIGGANICGSIVLNSLIFNKRIWSTTSIAAASIPIHSIHLKRHVYPHSVWHFFIVISNFSATSQSILNMFIYVCTSPQFQRFSYYETKVTINC